MVVLNNISTARITLVISTTRIIVTSIMKCYKTKKSNIL